MNTREQTFGFQQKLLVLALLAAILASLLDGALPAIRHFGFGFLTNASWDPVAQDFGALVPIFGTLVTASIALAGGANPRAAVIAGALLGGCSVDGQGLGDLAVVELDAGAGPISGQVMSRKWVWSNGGQKMCSIKASHLPTESHPMCPRSENLGAGSCMAGLLMQAKHPALHLASGGHRQGIDKFNLFGVFVRRQQTLYMGLQFCNQF